MKYETNFDKVEAMTKAFQQPVDEEMSDLNLLKLRRKLIEEEYAELMEEFDNAEKEIKEYGLVSAEVAASMLKEACDLLVVTYGAGVTFGWEMDSAFAEVNRSNMSKLDSAGKPIYRADGKVLKGPNYSPADVGGYI